MPSAGCESGTGGGGGVDGRRRLRVAAGGVRFLGVELAGFQRRAADRCNSGRWEEPAAWEDGSARRARNGDCRNESGGPPRPLRSRLLLRDGRPATAAGRGSGAGAEAGGNEDCGCNGGDRVEFATGDGRISVSASTAAASAEAGSRDWAAAATPPLAAVGVRESVGTGWNQRWPPRRPPGTGGCSCGGMPCAFVPFSRVPSTVLDEGTQSTDRPRPAKSCNPEAQQTSSSPPPRNARDRLIRVEKKEKKYCETESGRRQARRASGQRRRRDAGGMYCGKWPGGFATSQLGDGIGSIGSPGVCPADACTTSFAGRSTQYAGAISIGTGCEWSRRAEACGDHLRSCRCRIFRRTAVGSWRSLSVLAETADRG